MGVRVTFRDALEVEAFLGFGTAVMVQALHALVVHGVAVVLVGES